MANFTDKRFPTERQFRDVSGIGDTSDITPYQQGMYLAEEIFTQRIWGNDQFDEIVRWNNLSAEDKAAYPNNSLNQAFVDRFLNFMVFTGVYVTRVGGKVSFNDSGASLYDGGPNGSAPTEEDYNDSALFAWNMAAEFKERAIRWLWRNLNSYPMIGNSDSSEVRYDLSSNDDFPFTNID